MSSSRLVDELGVLLQALHLPLTLQSPTDLTPSLLLAILESILSFRLPLSPNFRSALSRPSTYKEARNAKIQCMQIFLGVLETDILKQDVGLNKIDPRKLANGDWDEVVYVGKILCWIGREYGITDDASCGEELHAWRLTPSTASDIYDTSISHSSSLSLPTADTSHSLHDFDNLRSFQAASSSSQLSPLVLSRTRRPHCIHEVPSPYAQDRQDLTTIGSETSSSSVRYSGYIQPVNEELELSYFESSRLGDRENTEIDAGQSLNQELAELLDPDPLARTISLLQQRSFLLRELAKYYGRRD
ncbi:hypothetical protein GGU10DRAFT_383823 [Lentinula aff. detonsa]|uniref:Uncharacterized protein n=1 Tax=Lentinula aff. detonsa TaxID=2804958 RepID=A0AA38NRK4_9AGAR|nr:hypothetical protein GGU10DRAFT_383823 [Lentinula aff. detonsa]